MAFGRFLGVDLAWRDGIPGRPANESGVAVLDAAGRVLDAGWTHGLEDTVAWNRGRSRRAAALLFVDAPLVVTNAAGQRLYETHVAVGRSAPARPMPALRAWPGSRYGSGFVMVRSEK
jgi:predicted RNase H-like nuclease